MRAGHSAWEESTIKFCGVELSSSTKNLRLHKPSTIIPQLSKSDKSVEHAITEKHCIDLSKIYKEFCVKGE
jgi:hypothetical protein